MDAGREREHDMVQGKSETARRLRKAMDLRGIERAQDLANASGVSKQSVSQYLNATYVPSSKAALKLSAVLGVSPVWLMGFDVDMIESPQIENERKKEEQSILNAYRAADDVTMEMVRRILNIKG